MKKVLLLATIASIISSCGSRSLPNSFSFRVSDYKIESTKLATDGSKIGEQYVNNENPRLSLKKFYWENNKLKAEVFYFDDKKLGPCRLYDYSGKLLGETFNYGILDSVSYSYNKDQLLLKKRMK